AIKLLRESYNEAIDKIVSGINDSDKSRLQIQVLNDFKNVIRNEINKQETILQNLLLVGSSYRNVEGIIEGIEEIEDISSERDTSRNIMEMLFTIGQVSILSKVIDN